jgi:NRPS condensation-like uncharacterized protein
VFGKPTVKYKTEAFDIWYNLCQISYEPLVRCRLDFEGRLDPDVLTQAVTLSMRTIPLIGCCFDDSANRPRWVEKGFTGKDMVRVYEADNDVDKQIANLLFSSIDFAREPQVKIFLVRRADGDTLCAVISHLVCDAAGFKQYLYLLSELYTVLKNDKPVPAYPFHPRGTRALFTDIKLLEKMRLLCFGYSEVFDPIEKEQPDVSFGKSNPEPYKETRKIAKEDFARLKSFAKAHGATVNDSMMALYARAFCVHTGTKKVTVPSSIDLRRFISPGVNYGITNYSSNCLCHISFGSDDSLVDTLQQISEQMQRHKATNSILQAVLTWELAVRFLPYFFLKRIFSRFLTGVQLVFTNLGILEQSLLCFDNLPIKNAYLTAATTPMPFLLLNASTYDDCCTLSCSFYGSDRAEKWVNALLDHMCAEIEALEQTRE